MDGILSLNTISSAWSKFWPLDAFMTPLEPKNASYSGGLAVCYKPEKTRLLALKYSTKYFQLCFMNAMSDL